MPLTSDALQLSLNPPADAIKTDGKNRPSPGIHSMKDEPAATDRLERIRNGDEKALRDLIRRFSPLVYGVALNITRSEADAADVMQDVFVGLPGALNRFDGRNFAGWLKVVASRRALMLLRSEKRRRKYSTASGRAAPQSLEDQTLTRIMIDEALDKLAANLRTVFVLKEMEGFTHIEIADALGISENLSQVRLHRARRALRELLT